MITIGDIEKKLLAQITDLTDAPDYAYNFRVNGEACGQVSSDHIHIMSHPSGNGLEVRIDDNTRKESCSIPVMITKTGYTEKVLNEFFVGENCDVTIIAGCGIHNSGCDEARHDGLHRFYVGKNSHIRYIEKHYGEDAEGMDGGNVMNPETEIYLEEGASFDMESTQIKGIDSTVRSTKCVVGDNASFVVKERLLTNGHQTAESRLDAELIGVNSSANIISRSVATDESKISFVSNIAGKNVCHGHTECDAIIVDNAKVLSVPALDALHPDAALIHEAAIGKIAGEQIIKLQTLGLTEEEAEQAIIDGFLK